MGKKPRVSSVPSEVREGIVSWDTATARHAVSGRLSDAPSISIDQVRKGLPIKALDDLAHALNVDRAALAEILGTSVRTLQRKAEGSDRLGPGASDRLSRVRRILDLATHVLGEPGKASRWLTAKSRSLNGEIPLQILDTDIGTQRVQQELRQIEFGMPL